MTALLVIRGDDFGSFPEANRAILAAHREGVLRNASVMAPAPAFAAGADELRACRGLCVGLHLAMSCEWADDRWGPISDPATVPSLVDGDGHFFADPSEPFRRGLVLDELMREAAAQLAAARRAGLEVRYVDEHMGIGWWHAPGGGPRFADRLRTWAADEHLVWHGDVVDDERAMLNARYAQPTPAAVAAAIAGLGPGTWLWLTHPGQAAGAMARARLRGGGDAPGSIAAERAGDTDLLRAPAVAHALDAAG